MSFLQWLATLSVILLSGCLGPLYNPERPLRRHYQAYQLTAPERPDQFYTCNHYGCNGQATVGLTEQQWQQIRDLFTPAAATAADERKQLAAAIGLMEKLVGPQSNTAADQACNNFRQPLVGNQLDCVAEATNTTVFLQLFQQAGLLRWHQVSYPAQRGQLLVFAAHVSAVIRQQNNGELFAVDSWFYANGENAVVMPLSLWQKNYYPAPCH